LPAHRHPIALHSFSLVDPIILSCASLAPFTSLHGDWPRQPDENEVEDHKMAWDHMCQGKRRCWAASAIR
jgi:hypothetical protein